jgi:uncharacterized protein YoxC
MLFFHHLNGVKKEDLKSLKEKLDNLKKQLTYLEASVEATKIQADRLRKEMNKITEMLINKE